jgi:hypothetical protein
MLIILQLYYIYWDLLLIVAKVHKFLFYTLLCRNSHKYGKSPQFGEIWSFMKSVSTAKITKIPCFRPEYNVKQRSVQHESC